MDSHPVNAERRPTHQYRCEHCPQTFRCTTAQYAHEDATHQGHSPDEGSIKTTDLIVRV